MSDNNTYDKEYEKERKSGHKIIDATMPPPKDTTTAGKIQPKHDAGQGTVGKLFIQSDVGRRRRRRRGEVDESVYEDFTRGLGFRPSNISKVNSRDFDPPQ